MDNKQQKKTPHISMSVTEQEHRVIESIRSLEFGRVICYVQHGRLFRKEVIKSEDFKEEKS